MSGARESCEERLSTTLGFICINATLKVGGYFVAILDTGWADELDQLLIIEDKDN